MDRISVLIWIFIVICITFTIIAALILLKLMPYNKTSQDKYVHRVKSIHDKDYSFNYANMSWDTELQLQTTLMQVTSVRVYVPDSYLSVYSTLQRAHPGKELLCPASSVLFPVKEWLWVHKEYSAKEYIERRLKYDRQLATNSLSDADLCYPTCPSSVDSVPPIPKYINPSQYIQFQVAPGLEHRWSNCKYIGVHFEFKSQFQKSDSSHCIIAAPYFHSIYQPDQPCDRALHLRKNTQVGTELPPWHLAIRQTVLLAFYGGIWRGRNRARIVSELQHISDSAAHGVTDAKVRLRSSSAPSASSNITLFSAPYVFANHSSEAGVWGQSYFYQRAWELYAASLFSWHPNGDSPTRRAFYDAWMFGSVPVVTKSAALQYQSIFGGILFGNLHGIHFEDVAVVFDDDIFSEDASTIIKYLLDMPDDEVRIRRERVALLAPHLQWGWCRAGDRQSVSSQTHPTLEHTNRGISPSPLDECVLKWDALRFSFASFFTG